MKEHEKRWRSAQQYEKNWWQKRINMIDPEFYHAYAMALNDELKGIFQLSSISRILEIGSGAAGMLTHLPGSFRMAIDPLESYYSSVEVFRSSRDPNVKYFVGKEEELPFKDNNFDLVIIDPVLDHCQDTRAVLSEIKRYNARGYYLFAFEWICTMEKMDQAYCRAI